MDAETMLWYEKPAENFDQALPIGNGRIGAMVFGGAADEVLKLKIPSGPAESGTGTTRMPVRVWKRCESCSGKSASPRRKRLLSKNYRA